MQKLFNSPDFDSWSSRKLALYTSARLALLSTPVTLDAGHAFDATQQGLIRDNIRDFNFTLYRVSQPEQFDLSALALLGRRFGLLYLDANLCAEEDRITVISDRLPEQDSSSKRYIPYTNKALGWHTDGYYNPESQRIRAFILHCQQAASSGGDNCFIDPEIVYILLHQVNPAYIEALMHPGAMTIPENSDGGHQLRAETSSAVFLAGEDDTQLEMRYTQRKRSIQWRDDSVTQAALACLNQILDHDSRWHIHYKLDDGEGIVANNILHNRSAYLDQAGCQRVFFRARYYQRINFANTGKQHAISQ